MKHGLFWGLLLWGMGCPPPAMAWDVSTATSATPPARWADYIAAMRKVDDIADDEARCRAYPDPPDNQWPAGTAQARCTLMRPSPLTLEGIEQLLQQAEGAAELERRFAALLKAHFDDPLQRGRIFTALDAFDASARAGEIAGHWLKLSPESPFANAALATHYANAGWKARGSQFVANTPAADLQEMGRMFMLAVPLYAAALNREPTLSPACVNLAAIGRQTSDDLQRLAMAHCLKVDPDGYEVVWEQIQASEPRWGGSSEALRAAVAYATARVERNPQLGALLGEFAGYAPWIADAPAEHVDELEGAALMGPSGNLQAHAGSAYRAKGDAWGALVYFSQATRFWPRASTYWRDRAGIYFDQLNDTTSALHDMRKALALAPGDGANQYRMGRIVLKAEGDVAARPYFQQAMQDARYRQMAMEMYCQGYVTIEPLLQTAKDCTRDLVRDYPDRDEAWRLRAFVLYRTRAPDALAALDRYLELADRNDPFQRSEVGLYEEYRSHLILAMQHSAWSSSAPFSRLAPAASTAGPFNRDLRKDSARKGAGSFIP